MILIGKEYLNVYNIMCLINFSWFGTCYYLQCFYFQKDQKNRKCRRNKNFINNYDYIRSYNICCRDNFLILFDFRKNHSSLEIKIARVLYPGIFYMISLLDVLWISNPFRTFFVSDISLISDFSYRTLPAARLYFILYRKIRHYFQNILMYLREIYYYPVLSTHVRYFINYIFYQSNYQTKVKCCKVEKHVLFMPITINAIIITVIILYAISILRLHLCQFLPVYACQKELCYF